MEVLVRTTLRKLILDHGRTLSADPRRCEAMLKDCCPAHRREIAALVVAQRSRVATDLLAPPAGQPMVLLLKRLVQRLLDEHPMTEDAARWAVESWALALGVIDAPPAAAPLPEPAPATAPTPEAPTPKPTPAPTPKAPAVHTPAKPVDPGPPDIHGWPAERVQELQRQAAAALGLPVVFRDPDFLIKVQRVRTGRRLVRRRLFTHNEYEPIYEDRQANIQLTPPEMVIIPAGRFLMGSPDEEFQRDKSEGPQHQVTHARPFAIGRYEVTFDDYDAFCTVSGRTLPLDLRWGRDRRPVIEVSWDDAQAYCLWLSGQTARSYRLPSEAEWEYACRAGTTDRYYTGMFIYDKQANVGRNNTKDKTEAWKTKPVGSYQANPWGLFDMHGNASEWVGDHWHDNYIGAPTNGSAWLDKGYYRVCRGGGCCRSAARQMKIDGLPHGGFRLTRALTP